MRRASEILSVIPRRFSTSWLSSDVQLGDVKDSMSLISTEFESLDYEVAENELYAKEADTRDSDIHFRLRVSLARWFVMFIIGVITALIAFAIDTGKIISKQRIVFVLTLSIS